MNCMEYSEYLNKYESGEIDRTGLRKMQEHEMQCPECAKMRQLADIVQDGLDNYGEQTPSIPEDIHNKWISQLKEERKTMPKMAYRFLAAIAAGLILIVFLFNGSNIMKKLSSTYNYEPAIPLPSESMRYASEYEEYAPEMSAEDTTALYAGNGSGLTSIADTVDNTRKIIRTASIEIRTVEFNNSLERIHQMCTDAGGWISSSSVVSKTGGMSATLTLRIPSEKLNSFLGGTGELGRIIRQDESAEDRTDSYRDTESRLKTQKMLLERLQNLVTTSEKLEDLLALEQQIAEIQYNIDSLTSSLKTTDQQVNYARVEISLKEEKKKEVIETKEVTFTERLVAAFELGFSSFSEFLQNVVLLSAAMIPYLFVLVCIVIIGLIVVRRVRRKKDRRQKL